MRIRIGPERLPKCVVDTVRQREDDRLILSIQALDG